MFDVEKFILFGEFMVTEPIAKAVTVWCILDGFIWVPITIKRLDYLGIEQRILMYYVVGGTHVVNKYL